MHWFCSKTLNWGIMIQFYQGNDYIFKWLYLDQKFWTAVLIRAMKKTPFLARFIYIYIYADFKLYATYLNDNYLLKHIIPNTSFTKLAYAVFHHVSNPMMYNQDAILGTAWLSVWSQVISPTKCTLPGNGGSKSSGFNGSHKTSGLLQYRKTVFLPISSKCIEKYQWLKIVDRCYIQQSKAYHHDGSSTFFKYIQILDTRIPTFE